MGTGAGESGGESESIFIRAEVFVWRDSRSENNRFYLPAKWMLSVTSGKKTSRNLLLEAYVHRVLKAHYRQIFC